MEAKESPSQELQQVPNTCSSDSQMVSVYTYLPHWKDDIFRTFNKVLFTWSKRLTLPASNAHLVGGVTQSAF